MARLLMNVRFISNELLRDFSALLHVTCIETAAHATDQQDLARCHLQGYATHVQWLFGISESAWFAHASVIVIRPAGNRDKAARYQLRGHARRGQ